MKKISIPTLVLVVVALTLFGINMIGKTQTATSSSAHSEVQYQPGPMVKAKAASPAPGPNAREKSKKGSIGTGKVMVTLRDANNDFWVEDMDMGGKGKMTETQMLWDNTEKVLYMAADKTMMCKNGGTANGSFLQAIYGKDNTMKRTAGSGWWITSLDNGECGMKTEALYGCKFNQNGNNTQCGVADLNEKTHDMVIIEATTMK